MPTWHILEQRGATWLFKADGGPRRPQVPVYAWHALAADKDLWSPRATPIIQNQPSVADASSIVSPLRWQQSAKSSGLSSNLQPAGAKADALREEMEEAANRMEICRVPLPLLSLSGTARECSGLSPREQEVVYMGQGIRGLEFQAYAVKQSIGVGE